MEALQHAAPYKHGRSRHVTRPTDERSECVGNKDDPRFLTFIKALKQLHEEQAADTGDVEAKTLDEYVAEAERRYWASRDPATEAARLLEEARRRLTTRQRKEGKK
jgi:hypothetical protein